MARDKRIEVDDVFVVERRADRGIGLQRPVYAHRRVVAIYGACVVYCHGGNRTVVCSAASFRRWAADAELQDRKSVV